MSPYERYELRQRRIEFWTKMMALVPVGMVLCFVLLATMPDLDQCLPDACDTVEILLRAGAMLIAIMMQMPFSIWLFYITRID
jgi:hypothetical protein